MKKKTLFVALPALVLLLGAVYLWAPSSVPPGQQTLVTLSNANFSGFASAFDADPDVPRLVLLLSPT